MSPKPTLYITINNHFDPTWRRAWKRRIYFDGETYASYADLEAYYILDNLALARENPEYAFEAESTIIVRTFLERHPEYLDALIVLAEQGRFGITGGGETIVDANMILGESLVRNYMVGLRWVEDVFGKKTRLAVRNDAFGNSAQLPQILRGCEIKWATGMSYTGAQGRYWRGLDGSTILHASLPIAAMGGGNRKYAPCPTCHGTGESDGTPCATCAGRGIHVNERARLPGEIDKEVIKPFNAALVPMAPEELLPNPALITWADALRDHYDVRFALEEDILPHLKAWLDAVDDPPEADIHPGVELNPNNSGCWVTRIKTKQTVRRQEYALLAAESICTMAALNGQAYPREAINQVWQTLFFTQFHDAITATHVDAAYAELEDLWEDIDVQTDDLRDKALTTLTTADAEIISVINPTGVPITSVTSETVPAESMLCDVDGQPVTVMHTHPNDDVTRIVHFLADVDALSVKQYHIVERDVVHPAVTTLDVPVIENDRFRIMADEHGLTSIFDKSLGLFIAQTDGYRPGELILEHDEGSPWATLHPDMSRVPLSAYTTLRGAEQSSCWQRLSYTVDTPRELGLSGKALIATVTYTLTAGMNSVEVHVDAQWSAFSQRLRVAFPVPSQGKHIYEIPYGQLIRAPYEPTFDWTGANGDWPAINWAGVQGMDLSVALLNKGLPSYRMESGKGGEIILLSLLRSPIIPTYLHEPEFYTMTDWNGMRDEGQHRFDFALTAYATPFAESPVVADAHAYNADLITVPGRVDLPAVPRVESEVAMLAAIKLGEAGDALILRIVEVRGTGGAVTITLPEGIRSAARVNLLERQAQPLDVVDGIMTFTLKPWEIATVRFT